MFEPGAVWRDTDGRPIQAHGGGVLHDNGTYYWYGENKDTPNKPRGGVDVIGVSCYSSRNLYDWKNEGVVLPAVPGDPGHDLHPSRVVERPKVLRNPHTGQYVLWMHVDNADYADARTGVAVADSPTGPFRYAGSERPAGADSRDMTVFQDPRDGAAYLLFSTDMNRTLKIARLTDDYLRATGTVTENFVGLSREAPAVFHHAGRYFLISSGCTGWAPNEAQYAVADSVLGPWEVRGNPCVGGGAETTFRSQSAFVLPVAGRPGAFIFLGDRWDAENLQNSRYVWLPMAVSGDSLKIEWRDKWDLSIFDQAL